MEEIKVDEGDVVVEEPRPTDEEVKVEPVVEDKVGKVKVEPNNLQLEIDRLKAENDKLKVDNEKKSLRITTLKQDMVTKKEQDKADALEKLRQKVRNNSNLSR